MPEVSWVVTSSSQIPSNQWTHVALVSYQGTIKLYINGVQNGTTSTSSFSDTSSPYFVVGDMYPNNTGQWSFKGYIDEFRVSKGIAHESAIFTPPNAPYGN